jgi:hypothetical protein
MNLFSASSFRDVLVASMSIASLVCTAYIMYFLPLQKPDTKGKRPVYLVEQENLTSPIRKYTKELNAGLCGILVLMSLTKPMNKVEDSTWSSNTDLWQGLLPSGMT